MSLKNEPEEAALYRAHVQGLIQCATTMTSSGFSRDRSESRSQKLMKKVFEIGTANLDQVLSRLDNLPEAERAEMLPRCSSGCDYCCFQWVRLTVSEVLAVYANILENYSADQQAELHKALIQYSIDFHSNPAGTRFSLGCPLLIDHRCSVYESRPLICRGTTSLDAEKCRQGKEDPAGDVLIPVIGPILNISWALRQGITLGLAEQGLPSSELVLGLALLVLFEDPHAAAKYFAGENVFQSAIAPN